MATHVERIEHLEQYVGQLLGTSPDRLITQSMVDAFADVTDDHQWLHVDPVRAASGPFGGTVAHGYLTLSLVAPMVHDVLTTDHQGFRINYGLNRVRFPSPVLVGSAIHADVTLREFRTIDEGVEILLDIVVSATGAAKPACVTESIYRFYGVS